MTITPSGTARVPARRTTGQVAVRTDKDLQVLLAKVADKRAAEPAQPVRTLTTADGWLLRSGGVALATAGAMPVCFTLFGSPPALALGGTVAAFLIATVLYCVTNRVRGARTHMQGR